MATRRESASKFRRLEPFRDIQEDILKLHGDEYREIFYRVRRIIQHQFSKRIEEGIKGFLFWGEVGVGKTAMAKALARDITCPLLFVDGSDIARARYGESEQLITDLFRGSNDERRIILIDDAESVFPRRDWVKGESWHIAQNNVLFHELDGLNTAKAVVILTTNEIDLMDRALRDRLFEIEFPIPSTEVLKKIARDRCEQFMIPWEPVIERIDDNHPMKSVRDVEKLVMDYYAEGTI